MNPYAILKVKDDTSDIDCKKALKSLYIKYHPDKVNDVNLKIMNETKFKEAQKAYEDIMIMRTHHNHHNHHNDNPNLARRSYNDMMHTIFKSEDTNGLFEPSFLDVKIHTDEIFREMEERMKEVSRSIFRKK